MATKADLFGVLLARGQYTVKQDTETPTQLRLLGSVPNVRIATQNWLVLMDFLNLRAEAAPWKVDTSKFYFRRGGKLWCAWRLIFQGEALAQHYDEIIKAIETAPRASRIEVTEAPLPGVGADRNARFVRTTQADPTGRR